MCIRPIAYNETTKIYTMLDEEGGHTFDILLSQIPFATTISNDSEWRCFVITCLAADCGATSTHPVSGGAAPPDIQLLASRLVEEKGCPCQLIPAAQEREVNLSHSKLHCAQMDGLGRWQVEENAAPSLDLLIDATNSYVVGLGPLSIEPANYTVINVGEEIITRVLSNTYTKFVDGDVVKAGPPNGN